MNTNELERLIQNPSERMDTELKTWMDPTANETIAKIVKGCFALRNFNGGVLIFGFDDKTGQRAPNPLPDMRTKFNPDKIQEIVSKYASQPFAIEVAFPVRDGIEHPVIIVPEGVESPVAANRELPGAEPHKPLIKNHAVYFRTLRTGGRISSAEATASDWPAITKICFDNREADVGAFIRRHLSNLNLGNLSALLTPQVPKLTAKQLAVDYLNVGRARFESARAGKDIPNLDRGTFEVAVVIDGEIPPHSANVDFYRKLQFNKPNHSGWSLWISNNSLGVTESPTVGGWESLTGAMPDQGGFDFWRAEPTGKFYHVRKLWDDCQEERGLAPKRQLDYALHTAHVSEAVSIGAHFARAMGCDEKSTTIGFACRWTGLSGRFLHSWSDTTRGYVSAAAKDDAITTSAAMSLETASSAFAPVVENLMMPMFDLFASELSSRVIEQIVTSTLSRNFGSRF